MKWNYIMTTVLTVLVAGVLCSCGTKQSIEISDEGQLKQIGPVVERTLETLIKSTQEMCVNVQDSYDTMLEQAAAENVSETGKKAATDVEAAYGERIKELSEIDFTKCTENELSEYTTEMSNIITAIREARDELTFN